MQWLDKIVEPNTRPSTAGVHRLLILDGHSSYLTPEFDQACKRSNIVAYCMLPGLSHLHPLKVGVSPVLNRLYGEALGSRMRVRINHVDKVSFLEMLFSIRIQAFTVQTVKNGFTNIGIAPFDPEKARSQLGTTTTREATTAPRRPSRSSRPTRGPKHPTTRVRWTARLDPLEAYSA